VIPPKLVIIAGPNGSGKSTLTSHGRLAECGLSLPDNYINADDIARESHESDEYIRDREAWRTARQLRAEYRGRGESFAFETVFSHPSTLLDMYFCKKAGYAVTIIYVTTGNVELNIERVRQRKALGGHSVPEDKIRQRYQRSLSLLPRAIEDADEALVFDSSKEEPMTLCYRKTNSGALGIRVPPYLQEQLVDALNIRELERHEITQQFGSVHPPDENNGKYFGKICHTTTNYCVQAIDTISNIRHDTRLLSGTIPLDEVTIEYREGEGSHSS
jgi:predicted ABC-type ATPase